jgi:Tol biopolymer transport system component
VNPFWSPDSRSLAYWASGKLWRVELGGGSPVAICDLATPTAGADWGADGQIVFGATGGGLQRVSASGGKPEPLTTRDGAMGETSHRHPQLLPGGRILYLSASSPGQEGVYATSFANPRERVRIVASSSNGLYASGHLLWLRGSTLVAQPFDPDRLRLSGEPRPIADPVSTGEFRGMVVAVAGGLLAHGSALGGHFNWTDRAGKVQATLGEPDSYGSLRLSPDGRKVVVPRGSETRTLWMGDVERDAWTRFTFMPSAAILPVWSPDARHVVFRAGTPANLYRKEASGAGAEQRVTESANTQSPDDWSRDGRVLIYGEQSPETKSDLWVLPVGPDGAADAGAKPRPYLRTLFNEWGARFSPEPGPRWVAYSSDESGKNEVYARAFPEPRGKFQISVGGGRFPEWSPDGPEMYYVSPAGKLTVVDLKLGTDSVVPSTPRELFSLSGTGPIQPYSVAPDGKRFLVRASVGGSRPLEVVVNWPALLQQGSGPE